jgi:tRNA A37 threonylcarbamoyladenosine modification protein TsaB
MHVLAIDTALEACSVAVIDTADVHGRHAHESLPMQRGHAEALMPLVRDVMEKAGVGFADAAGRTCARSRPARL